VGAEARSERYPRGLSAWRSVHNASWNIDHNGSYRYGMQTHEYDCLCCVTALARW